MILFKISVPNDARYQIPIQQRTDELRYLDSLLGGVVVVGAMNTGELWRLIVRGVRRRPAVESTRDINPGATSGFDEIREMLLRANLDDDPMSRILTLAVSLLAPTMSSQRVEIAPPESPPPPAEKKKKKRKSSKGKPGRNARARVRVLCRIMELRISITRYFLQEAQYMDRVRSRVALSLGAFDESGDWKYGRKVLSALDALPREKPEELVHDMALLRNLERELDAGHRDDLPDDDLQELQICLQEDIAVLSNSIATARRSLTTTLTHSSLVLPPVPPVES